MDESSMNTYRSVSEAGEFGLTVEIAKDTLERHPTRLLERAVKRMLPRTKLGRAQLTKLHIYAGTEHPHEAQKPQELKYESKFQ